MEKRCDKCRHFEVYVKEGNIAFGFCRKFDFDVHTDDNYAEDCPDYEEG